jgi:hypothetical protein
MSTIGGKKRETTGGDFTKKVGLFEGKVLAINPTLEQFKVLLDMEVGEDSKMTEYLGERDGNTTLRVDVWMGDVKSGDKFKTSFFLEDKVRENKDGDKFQYINEVGMCSWASDPNELADWFTARDFRKAYVGEEDLYNFLRTWLSKLDYRDADTVLQLDWKKLMKGNVKDIKDEIDGEYCGNVGALATVISKEKDGEVKEYQGVYNKAFVPAYSLKNFRLVDYKDESVLAALRAKKTKDLKVHEKFVLTVEGDYGCKDFYILKDIKDYNADENLVASNTPLATDDSSY